MSILPKLIYRCNANSITIPARIFIHIDKLILKFLWKGSEHRLAQTILKKKKKNKVRRITVLNTKVFCVAMFTVVLAETKIHKSIEQSREPRNRHTQVCTADF